MATTAVAFFVASSSGTSILPLPFFSNPNIGNGKGNGNGNNNGRRNYSTMAVVSAQEVLQPGLDGRHFRITAVHEDGFLEIADVADGNSNSTSSTSSTNSLFSVSFSGYLVEMMAAIAQKANFTYTLVPPSGLGSKCVPQVQLPDEEWPSSPNSSSSSTASGLYSPTYRTQYNCGTADVTDVVVAVQQQTTNTTNSNSTTSLSLSLYGTDMYLGMYYVTPSRMLENHFTIPFVPPYSGTLAMFGTAVGIPTFEALVEKQKSGEVDPSRTCGRAGTALIDSVQESFPGLQVRGIFGGEQDIYQAFYDGTCTVYITDAPIAAQFVLRRSRRGECTDQTGMVRVVCNERPAVPGWPPRHNTVFVVFVPCPVLSTPPRVVCGFCANVPFLCSPFLVARVLFSAYGNPSHRRLATTPPLRQPIGVIGSPMQFGLSHYAIGIRQDIPQQVVDTISYWMTVLMTCNPLDPAGPCPEGNFASMYEGRGGTGEECGYVLYPKSGGRLLPAAAVAGIVVGCTLAVLAVFVAWHRHRLRREQRRYAKRSKVAVEQAEREREFNEFMAHEVRNPLASALAALSFVSSKTSDPSIVPNDEQRALVQSDVRVIDSSLQFVNDLLRNMMDVHRTQTGHGIKLHRVPTDVMGDIFEPIATILFMRGANVDVQTVCNPEGLLIRTDRMRLKQILMNLASNATKFVTKGYIRLRAAVETVPATGESKGQPPHDVVVLYVEDSGPGIPLEKRKALFMKFQDSLDVLNQGTGIGLAVCKNLSDLMGASLTLQDDFDSGIPDCPGTCFRLQLAEPPLHLDVGGHDSHFGGVGHSFNGGNSNRDSCILSGMDDVSNDALSGSIRAELPENLSVL